MFKENGDKKLDVQEKQSGNWPKTAADEQHQTKVKSTIFSMKNTPILCFVCQQGSDWSRGMVGKEGGAVGQYGQTRQGHSGFKPWNFTVFPSPSALKMRWAHFTSPGLYQTFLSHCEGGIACDTDTMPPGELRPRKERESQILVFFAWNEDDLHSFPCAVPLKLKLHDEWRADQINFPEIHRWSSDSFTKKESFEKRLIILRLKHQKTDGNECSSTKHQFSWSHYERCGSGVCWGDGVTRGWGCHRPAEPSLSAWWMLCNQWR